MNGKCEGTYWLGVRGWREGCLVQNGDMSELWSKHAIVIQYMNKEKGKSHDLKLNNFVKLLICD
jgi:peptide deformylase